MLTYIFLQAVQREDYTMKEAAGYLGISYNMLYLKYRDAYGKIIETKIQFSKSIHILNIETGLSSMLSFVSTI